MAMITCDEMKEMSAAWALGSPDATEITQVAEAMGHLTECEDCRQRLGQDRAVAAAMPLALDAVLPPRALKGRLIGRIDRSPRRPLASARLTAAVAASLAIGFALGTLVQARRIQDLKGARSELALLQSRQTEAFALAGDFSNHKLAARAFWAPSRREFLLIVENMPPPPPGKDYQLWFIAGDRKISGGLLPASAGTWTVSVPVEHFEAAAFTLEPASGVPQPTGPVVMLGKI